MELGELKKYFKDLFWVASGMGLAMLVDYSFNFFAGRMLGPEGYGVLGVIFSIFYILVRSPGRALELTSKKLESEGKDATAQLGRPALQAGIAMAVVFAAFSGVIASLLGLPYRPLLYFSLAFPVAYLLPVVLGKLHGAERFREYAIYEVIGSLASFGSLGLVLLGWGVAGAVFSPVNEVFVGFVVTYLFVGSINLGSGFSDYSLLKRSSIFIFCVNAAFSIDILLMSVYQPAKIVGYYAAVAVLGKALFYGSVAVNRSVFPKLVKQEHNRKNLLNLSLLILAVEGLFAVLFFTLLGRPFIGFTFGSEFLPAAAFAPIYMLFISLVTGVAMIGNYYLSTDMTGLKRILLLPAVQLVLLVFLHGSPVQFLTAGIIASLVAFVALYLPVLKIR